MTFLTDEDGAITVDWVVLTAAVVILPIAIAITVSGGIGDVASKITGNLSQEE